MLRPDLSFRFDRWFEKLPRSPREVGTVRRLVLRTGPGQRATPEAIEVVPGEGALGDTWKHHRWKLPGNEIALVNVHVIRDLAGGDDERTALSGDNLQVDLDLSEENLPVGARLAVGEDAILRVSDVPHHPCEHFVERFGASAATRGSHDDGLEARAPGSRVHARALRVPRRLQAAAVGADHGSAEPAYSLDPVQAERARHPDGDRRT